ncbi:hypothetical protein Nepgr_016810 [Nepenthes gracilis]|uniref:Uncharacterized protein n=1 Tax=Nepenthes gracilis TaxID=150966 RepID=A0AAD3XSH4_NEPGR|nr:hypothetical protein Nepgr_016810 [Nepenthes gracilis]
MAIQEHSYFASLGYHVTTCFAPRSRFGTPEELKSLIDRARELGLFVVGNIVHNHVSKTILEGLNLFEETDDHYYHYGKRGYQGMWVPRLFT